MNTEIFYQALRERLRFPTATGELTTEQLWEIPLTSSKVVSLDAIAKSTHRTLKAMDEESFVAASKNPEKKLLELKLDVLKEVIRIRQEEIAELSEAASKKQLKQQLTDILAQKQQKSLLDLSEEEIQKKLQELGV